jgi:hypothetical protein
VIAWHDAFGQKLQNQLALPFSEQILIMVVVGVRGEAIWKSFHQ